MPADWVACPVPHGPRTFVLQVEGQANAHSADRRTLNEGDYVFVDPDAEAQANRLVLVRRGDELLIRLLTVEGAHRMLSALNPGWPDRFFSAGGDVQILGVVVAKHIPL
jgi:SOS-response transcriptional repressor LexA